jgi:hypothetical protein
MIDSDEFIRVFPKAKRDLPSGPPPPGVARYFLARDLAGPVFPMSEAVILQEARRHGVGRKMGRAIVFSPDDIKKLYEALTPCRSPSSVAPSRPTGSYAAPSAAAALKRALELAKKNRRGNPRQARE